MGIVASMLGTACASDEGIGEGAEPRAEDIRFARAPKALELIAQARSAPRAQAGAGRVDYHFTVRDCPACDADRRSGRGQDVIELMASGRADGVLRVRAPSSAEWISVRKVGASPAPAEPAGKTLTYPDAWPGTDAVWFETGAVVEELLIVRLPTAYVEYDIDLPAGWAMRQPGGFSGLVELFDGRGVARLRFRADRAWDATGAEQPVTVQLATHRVRIGLPTHAPLPLVVDPSWGDTGGLAQERSGHTTTLLATGEVLVTGGSSNASKMIATAELYDPRTGTFRAAANAMSEVRYLHTATTLLSGKVLVAGGNVKSATSHPADVFDPATSSFTAAGELLEARARHAAVLLPSGEVLFAGGTNLGDGLLAAEVYDPGSGLFSAAGSMARARIRHSATVLPSGEVLIAGGCDTGLTMSCQEVLGTAELYEPTSHTFALAPEMSAPRQLHTATLLGDGRVLVTGGDRDDESYENDTSELYDPGAAGGAGAWVAGPAMASARAYHSATLLPSGLVVIAGGCKGSYCDGDQSTAELFDPGANGGAGAFLPAAPLHGVRSVHGATLLASGKLLMVGGVIGTTDIPTAEVYEPIADDEELAGVTSKMSGPKAGHTATRLLTGEVLFAGGCNDGADFCTSHVPSGEVFQPEAYWSANGAAGTWQPQQGGNAFMATGSLGTTRETHTATVLRDGKVIVAGGFRTSGAGISAAELFERGAAGGTGGFAAAGALATGRGYHTATLLPSGKVLIAGGCEDWECKPVLGSVEIYVPGAGGVPGEFLAGGPLLHARGQHTATLLESGKVLIAGGLRTESGDLAVREAELYDPEAEGGLGRSVEAGLLGTGRAAHSATLLPNGTVLLAGGFRGTDPLDSCELYDPRLGEGAGGVTLTGSLGMPRGFHTATLLPWGEVLIAGGLRWYPTTGTDAGASDPASETTELFDPAAGRGKGEFRASASMSVARAGHTATLLATGDVLIAGGRLAVADVYYADAELWRRKDVIPDGFRPLLTPPQGEVEAGTIVPLDGQRLMGISEASSGCVGCSASNVPLLFWMPADGSALIRGMAAPFSPTSLQWQVPVTGILGPGFAHVVTNGAMSTGAPAMIGAAADGLACPGDGACASGFCVDGLCCNTACGGVCEACTAAKRGAGKDGECGPISGGLDPDEECARDESNECGLTGACSGVSQCEVPADGVACADGGSCQSGACVLETGAQCDDHVLRHPDGTETDCSPYRCTQQGACTTPCSTTADCVAGTRCDPQGRCIPRMDVPMDGERVGCGCRGVGRMRDSRTWGAAALLLMLACFVRRGRAPAQ